MNGRSPTRRHLLQMAGASLVLGVSGCLGGKDTSSDSEQSDGYAPQSKNGTEKTNGTKTKSVDVSSFPTRPTRGTSVPLVPIDVAHDWYVRREARFADARGETGYEKAHIKGAVLSPAPKGQTQNDPVENWPKSDRIITYCACPHHLSSLRAANLINQGYKNVFALDDGFLAWMKRKYPVVGSETTQQPNVKIINGQTAPQYAGKTAWAYHRPSGQREATTIESKGLYSLRLPFYDVTGDSLIEIETPDYTIEKSLSVLTSKTITPEGTLSVK